MVRGSSGCALLCSQNTISNSGAGVPHSACASYRAALLKPGMRRLGSPKSMNFIPWKKMLGGYHESLGFRSVSFSFA